MKEKISKKLILASQSPRRKEILSCAGFDFEVIPSSYDEKISNLVYEKSLVENCAYNKALDVFKKHQDSLIISSDTVVVSDKIILGKPKNFTDAFNMLKNLSNKTHFVASAICLMDNNKTLCDTQITYVTFRILKDKEITDYINNKKPYDKAGSYGIQDEGFDFALSSKGEINNVIGFPLELFKKMLKEFQ